MSLEKKYYGWYSVQMATSFGTSIYKTPDGKEVEITCITTSNTDSGTQWDDISLIGEVSEYIRKGFVGECSAMFDEFNNMDKNTPPSKILNAAGKLRSLIEKTSTIQDKVIKNPYRWN